MSTQPKTKPQSLIPGKVKAFRKGNYLTQNDLAHMTGLTQGSIARIENAESANISIESAFYLAQAFGITIDELIQ